MENTRLGLVNHAQTFVGLTCRKATTGLAQTLGLWFEPPPEWQSHDWSPVIQTYSSAWRIVEAGAVLAGQYDDSGDGRTLEAALGRMEALVLTGIELHAGLPDARFTFSDDLVVEFFTIGRHDKAWEALLPTAKWIEVGPDVTWREVASDDPGREFTAEERRFSDHAHAFGQRWRSRMPPPSPPGRTPPADPGGPASG